MGFFSSLFNGLGTILGVLVDTVSAVVTTIFDGYDSYRKRGGAVQEVAVAEAQQKKDRLRREAAVGPGMVVSPKWDGETKEKKHPEKGWIKRVGPAGQSKGKRPSGSKEPPCSTFPARLPWRQGTSSRRPASPAKA